MGKSKTGINFLHSKPCFEGNMVKKRKPFVMPSKGITNELLDSALKALQQLAVQYKQKNKIFDDDTQIFLEINSIRIQNGRGNIAFFLPHSTVATTGEVCLITPDLKKGQKVDHEPTIDHWEDMLKKDHVTAVKTILPMRQLRVEYDQFELKRRLLTQHDFIMVDSRVLNHVSHLLGKMFFQKHNMLIPVRLHKRKDLKHSIDVGLRTAMLRLKENGPTSTLLIGHMAMPLESIKENIVAFIKQLSKFPGGEANIRSIAMKLPLSLSLPIYFTLRSSDSVGSAKLKRVYPKACKNVEGELSTLSDTTVVVTSGGSIKVNKQNIHQANSDIDTDDGEEDEEHEHSNDEGMSDE